MGTAEQILEAIMTSVAARVIEVFAAPIFIWFKAGKSKKDWPKPILLGFVIIVLASCLFLEGKVTGWVKEFTYAEQQVIRDWLDEQKYTSSLESTKDYSFRFKVSGNFNFEIAKRRDSIRTVSFATSISLNPSLIEEVKSLSESQRRILWSDLLLELSRHGIFLPAQPADASSDVLIPVIVVQRTFPFPPGSSKDALYSNLSDLKAVKSVIDLFFDSWKAQRKM